MSIQTEERTAQTSPATCQHVVNTAKGIKPCVKPAGHEGGHASRIQERKEYRPVAKSVLASLETVGADEDVTYGGGKRATERSAEQKTVDKHVKDAYSSWVTVGRPRAFADMPRRRYFCSPEDEQSVRAMLRSAAQLHGVSVRIAPLAKHQSGKHMLVWAAADVNKREQ